MNKDQDTPLHLACKKGSLPIVQYLIEKGVDIEAKDIEELTPLHYACQNGHLPIVQYLMKKEPPIVSLEARSESMMG